MMPPVKPPTDTVLRAMVERFFDHVITPPSGWAYLRRNGKLFLPVANKDEWCMTLRDLATGATHPVFFTSDFLDNLTKALAATQVEFDKTMPKAVIQ